MKFTKTFVIRNADIRTRVIEFINALALSNPHGWKVVITEDLPAQTTQQVRKYHAQLRDIAVSGKFVHGGRSDWAFEDVKQLMKEAFAHHREQEKRPLRYRPRFTQSLDGQRIVQLDWSTRELLKEEASEFIEMLYAWGSEKGVVWTGEAMPGQG